MSLPDPIVIATIQKNRRESVRVALSEYKGTNLVDLRVFAPKAGEEGATVPTPKGLSCNVIMLPALCRALNDAPPRLSGSGSSIRKGAPHDGARDPSPDLEVRPGPAQAGSQAGRE
jgi:hypothetical protein